MFRRYFAGLISVAVLLSVLLMALSVQANQSPQGPQPPQREARRSLERWPQAPAQSAAAAQAGPTAPAVIQGLRQWSRIVFQSYRDGNWEIYSANGDGTGQQRLMVNSASDTYPRLNRGGTRLAFDSNRTGTYQIYTMNLDGTGLSQITTSTSNNYDPAWSPDGSKIAFESFRDGQAEIYVMNANGTGLIRLTNNPAFDGHPTWSPDGAKIAFTSDRGTPANTGNRIWVMNADGSSAQQLTTQYYGQNPNWSPDGTRIAFDADATNDSSQEIWLMNTDGSGQIQVYDPPDESPLGYPGLTDAWVRGWSPDGTYVTYTRLTWIYYQGAWYWYTGFLEAFDPTTLSAFRLVSTQGDDWYPDWQSLDIGVPASHVNALAAQSPGPFAVSWSGSDTGPSGIQGYDVQVRDGDAGTWADWQLNTAVTSASYPGLGGHIYYFRSRARDNADNVEAWSVTPDASTTVEALPPVVEVLSMPPYTRGAVTVYWRGSDPGGSGIQTYDVQYRDQESGVWTDWQTAVTATAASYSGIPGHAVEFRVRAIDRAFNQSDWSVPDSQKITTFYSWLATGKAWDNAHYHVAGVAISITPEYLASFPSDGTLTYKAYGATITNVYSATWSVPGYGNLPITPFRLNSEQNAYLDVILPPLDNILTAGNFETGDWSGTPWQIGGTRPPVITATVGHTGHYAAMLGCDLFQPAAYISGSSIATDPQLAMDAASTLHVVWRTQLSDDNADILYSSRPKGGSWSALVNISNTSTWSDWPHLTVDSSGAVHVVWEERLTSSNSDVLYARRAPAGTWSAPQNISNNATTSRSPELVTGISDVVHVVWEESDLGVVRYMQRAPTGSWTGPVTISGNSGTSYEPDLVADSSGGVHVVWRGSDAYYAYRAPGGNWTIPHLLSGGGIPAIAIGQDGTAHVLSGFGPLLYASRTASGVWSTPQTIPGDLDPHILIDSQGTVHIVSGGFNSYPLGSFFYIQRRPDGTWSESVDVVAGQTTQVFPQRVTPQSTSARLALDQNGVAHVVWEHLGEVFYSRRSPDGKWLDSINLSNNPGDSYTPRIVIDHDGMPSVVWQDMSLSNNVAYADLATTLQTDEASIAESVVLPLTLTSPTLSFLYKNQPGVTSPISGNAFVADIEDAAGTHPLLTTKSVVDAWTHESYDLSAWAGQPITLTFRLKQSANQPCQRAYLDEVTIGSWLTPVPLMVQPQRIRASQTALITITGLNFIGTVAGAPYPVQLGNSYLLDAHWINSATLTATVPYSVPFGTYDVFVTNPGGQSGVLPNGLLIGERAYLPLIRR